VAEEKTMTDDRDRKDRIRARMAKTGESYSTARAHLTGEEHRAGTWRLDGVRIYTAAESRAAARAAVDRVRAYFRPDDVARWPRREREAREGSIRELEAQEYAGRLLRDVLPEIRDGVWEVRDADGGLHAVDASSWMDRDPDDTFVHPSLGFRDAEDQPPRRGTRTATFDDAEIANAATLRRTLAEISARSVAQLVQAAGGQRGLFSASLVFRERAPSLPGVTRQPDGGYTLPQDYGDAMQLLWASMESVDPGPWPDHEQRWAEARVHPNSEEEEAAVALVALAREVAGHAVSEARAALAAAGGRTGLIVRMEPPTEATTPEDRFRHWISSRGDEPASTFVAAREPDQPSDPDSVDPCGLLTAAEFRDAAGASEDPSISPTAPPAPGFRSCVISFGDGRAIQVNTVTKNPAAEFIAFQDAKPPGEVVPVAGFGEAAYFSLSGSYMSVNRADTTIGIFLFGDGWDAEPVLMRLHTFMLRSDLGSRP
jgi:hypothetical protein